MKNNPENGQTPDSRRHQPAVGDASGETPDLVEAGRPWYQRLYPDLDPVRDKTLHTVMNYRLKDDLFARVALKDIKTVQRILQIILEKPDLKVLSVETQKLLDNGVNRSAWLDVLAEDSTGKRLNVEVQNGKKGFSPLRMRFYASLLDVTDIPKNGSWQKLRETYIIFLTDRDYPGGNQPVYEYEVLPKNHDTRMDFGIHYLVVNGEWRRDDGIGRLMSDFDQADPFRIQDDVLAERCRNLKLDNKEVQEMCDEVQKLIDEGEQKGREEGLVKGREEGLVKGREEGLEEGLEKGLERAALNLLKEEFSVEVATRATGLSPERVQELADSLKKRA